MFSAANGRSASAAATARPLNVEAAPPEADAEPSARHWLRLVRGAAAEPVRELAREQLLSVGSGPSCDWQIAAEGVPALALWLRVLAGSLFVRAGGTTPVSVDGHGLGTLWTPITHGARLSVGGASIEVGLSGRSRAAQSQHLQRALARVPDAFGAPRAPLAAPDVSEPSLDAEDPWALEDPPEPTATIFGADDESSPDEVEPRRRALRPSWHASLWIAGGLLACLYGCWVLLLDRL